jgi:predicted dienelactone hydrolase
MFDVVDAGEVVLHDAARQKDLPVHVFYPSGGGPYPVIVFSHGASASGFSYFDLTRYWTAAGYVVLQPTHADSIRLRRRRGERVGVAQGLREAVQDATANPGAAADRARDISLVIDSLAEVERRIPAVQGKMDHTCIGVGGHSFGATTTMLIGGAGVFVEGSAPASYRDSRVRAIEALSGPGDSPKMGFSQQSWEALSLPMLCMTGSRDGFGPHGKSRRKNPFDFSPAGDKFYIFIEGATHFSFVGERLSSLLSARVGGAGQQKIFGWIQMATLAFWDAYLKGKPAAKGWLAAPALEELSHRDATIERR